MPERMNEDRDTLPIGAAITLEDLAKVLNPTFAIRAIRLHVQAGEFFCLLGSSGSGKSTLLGLIGGWIVADAGRIMLSNTDYTKCPAYLRPVRTCFQKGGFLFPHMTVRDNIAYALRVKRHEHDSLVRRTDDIMLRVGLAGLAERKPAQLSGGEAQRVAIARALVDPQPVLLLDEIQTGLDRGLRDSIRDLLVELTQNLGVTTVYVTHDGQEALALSSRLRSRLGVLHDGRLEQVGTAEQLYRAPTTSTVATALGDLNLLTVREVCDEVIETQQGLRFTVSCRVPPATKHLAFRFEDVSLISAGRGDINLPGTVERVEFLGHSIRVSVRTSGELLTAVIGNNGKAPLLGDHVTCILSQKNLIALER